MAEIFTNAKQVLGTTATMVYTCPVGSKAIIIGCQVTHIANDLRDLDFYWTDASDANSIAYLGKTIKIPPQVSYNPIGGKVVLDEGDAIYGICNVAAEMHFSLFILEIS